MVLLSATLAALIIGSIVPEAVLVSSDGVQAPLLGKRGRFVAVLVGREPFSKEDTLLIRGAGFVNPEEKPFELVCAFAATPEELREFAEAKGFGPVLYSAEQTFFEAIGAWDGRRPQRNAFLLNPGGRVVRVWESPSPESFGKELADWLTGSSLPIGAKAPDPREFLKLNHSPPFALQKGGQEPLYSEKHRAEEGQLSDEERALRAVPLSRETFQDAPIANRLSPIAPEKGLLVLFLATRGPVDALYTNRINAVAERCKEVGVAIVGLFPAYDETAEEVAAFAATSGFEFPCSVDPDSVFADAYRATRTPEVFLLSHSPKDDSLRVFYTGAIDSSTWDRDENSRYLLDAVSSLMAGGNPRLERTMPFGTIIRRSEADDRGGGGHGTLR